MGQTQPVEIFLDGRSTLKAEADGARMPSLTVGKGPLFNLKAERA